MYACMYERTYACMYDCRYAVDIDMSLYVYAGIDIDLGVTADAVST